MDSLATIENELDGWRSVARFSAISVLHDDGREFLEAVVRFKQLEASGDTAGHDMPGISGQFIAQRVYGIEYLQDSVTDGTLYVKTTPRSRD